MNENEKKYSVIGTVTIGTDEYRDLIESRMEVEKSKDYYMRESWKKDEEIKNLKERVEALTTKLNRCEKFFKSQDVPSDIVSVFMSIFGED